MTSEMDLLLAELRDYRPHHRRVDREKDAIDLGLALLAVVSKGEPLTCDDIAAWCDCSRTNIHKIEQRALKKLRVALRYREPELCAALRAELR